MPPWAQLRRLWLLVAACIGKKIIERQNNRERFRKRQVLNTVTLVLALIVIVILWPRLLEQTATFLGLVAAGLAIALKEPLLAIAGRIAILWRPVVPALSSPTYSST